MHSATETGETYTVPKRLTLAAAIRMAATATHAGTLDSVRQKGFLGRGNIGCPGRHVGKGSTFLLDPGSKARWANGGLLHVIPMPFL
jgi:hypothetical protein